MENILYSLLFFSLLGGEILRLQFPSSIAVSLLDCSVFLLVILSFARFLHMRKQLIPRYFVVPFLLFCLIAFCSLLVQARVLTFVHLGISFLYLVRWIFYAGLLFVVANDSRPTKKFISILQIATGGVFVIIGFLQYIFYPALRNLYYLGWDEHLYRLFSTFLDPNFASVFLVLYGFFLFFHFKKQKDLRSSKSYLLLFCILLTFVGVVLTFSRSGLLMLVFMAVLYTIIIERKKYLFAILLSCILLVISLLPFSHIENTDLFRTASSGARVESAKIAISIFSKNPILGVGFNAYRYAQVRYGFRPSETLYPSHANSGTDNSFLFLLATTGIVGTSVFILFVYRLFAFSWRLYKEKHSQAAFLFLLSLAGLVVSSMFINSLFYPPLMLWVSVLGGIMSRDAQ